MRRFLHFCLNRTPAVGLLMAALLFRALIPTGFMPVATDGAIVMELCSGFTTKSVVVHLGQADHASHAGATDGQNGSHDSSHDDLFEHSPCGFAAATAAGPPATQSAVVPVAPQVPPAESHTAALALPSILRSQTSRGPPFA